jgi:hypothetical protein
MKRAPKSSPLDPTRKQIVVDSGDAGVDFGSYPNRLSLCDKSLGRGEATKQRNRQALGGARA